MPDEPKLQRTVADTPTQDCETIVEEFTAMPAPKIEELLLLMDHAFADSEHSLLKNLSSVKDDSWTRTPEGGERSIRDIVAHVSMFKFMYANHGFGAGDYDYGDPPATPAAERLVSVEAAADILREGHEYLTGSIRELADDSELDVLRKTHWGGLAPTRLIIVTMIEHDVYHAGEVNRSRALLQNDDAWFALE